MNQAQLVRPFSRMRKVIAARMKEASSTIPHFRVSMDIRMDAVIRWRRKLSEQNSSAGFSLNDVIIKACATALVETPTLNSQCVGEELHQFANADISIITAVPDGLATPIIWAAETKSVWQISQEVKGLAARAKNGSLRLTDIVGGSFSISNLGMYGVDAFDAIINPPQSGILAIGCAKPTAVVSQKTGQIEIATVMRVTLSADHRAVDGTTAAAFLSTLRDRLEQPEALLNCGNDQT